VNISSLIKYSRIILLFVIIAPSSACMCPSEPYGCITKTWNDTIDRRLAAEFKEDNQKPYKLPSDRSNMYASAGIGYYMGTRELKKAQYNDYVMPDVFTNTSATGLIISLPIYKNSGTASLVHLPMMKINEKPVIVIYSSEITSLNGYERIGCLNLNCAHEFLSNLAAINTLSPELSSAIRNVLNGNSGVVLFELLNGGSKASVRIINKKQPDQSADSNSAIYSQSYLVCDIKNRPGLPVDIIINDVEYYSKYKYCSLWYASDIFEVSYDEPSIYYVKNGPRYAMYIVTVPLDILTSPFQLSQYLVMRSLFGYWSFK